MNMTDVVLVVHMHMHVLIWCPNKTKVLFSISATISSHCIINGEIPKKIEGFLKPVEILTQNTREIKTI